MRCEQRADDDGRNNPVAERQTKHRAEHLRHNGRDEAENDAAGLCLSKKINVDLKAGCKHQHQPPEIAEELHDWVVHRSDVKNVRP